MRFNVNQPQQRDGDSEWTPLATGQYLMKIAEAKIAPSPFENDDGEKPDELTIVWQLADWNEEYAEAGYQSGQKVFQRFNPWYGESRKGPSKFKQFIDPLIQEGLIPPEFEVAQDDLPANQGDLIGLTRRVMVEHYTKSMGVNKGQPGNRVLAVTSLPRAKGTVKEVVRNGGKVDLADVDATDGPTAPSDRNSMTHSELVGYAQSLAAEAGGEWAGKQDWDTASDGILRARITRMEKALSTPVAVTDDQEELF